MLGRADGLKGAAGGKRQFLSKRAPYSFNTLLSGREPLPDGGIWEDIRIPVPTAVLCKNALLVVHPKGGDKQDLKNWQLSALKREDGSTIWTMDLPQRPVWDGLSVAADGSILVAMWDGSLICLK
mgnify:CR=1 FL=1